MENNRIDTTSLGLLLKYIGDFNNGDFPGRLRMQKIIYLLQSFGIDLGYKYYWYIHGVYSKELSQDGKDVATFIEKLEDMKNPSWHSDIKNKMENFIQFIENKKSNADDLEILSSIHYLNRQGFDDKKVLEMVESKKPEFTKEDCIRLWNELKKFGLMPKEAPAC